MEEKEKEKESSVIQLTDFKIEVLIHHLPQAAKDLHSAEIRLEAHGVPSKQAEAITAAITGVLNDSLETVSHSFTSKKVCDCLLKKGPLPLREIVRYTELSETLVRNCLLVLIQHNYLQPFLLEEEGGFGEVNKEFNKLCVDLIETLLQHGRLSSEQIFLMDLGTVQKVVVVEVWKPYKKIFSTESHRCPTRCRRYEEEKTAKGTGQGSVQEATIMSHPQASNIFKASAVVDRS